jgi:hypothetical protein
MHGIRRLLFQGVESPKFCIVDHSRADRCTAPILEPALQQLEQHERLVGPELQPRSGLLSHPCPGFTIRLSLLSVNM